MRAKTGAAVIAVLAGCVGCASASPRHAGSGAEQLAAVTWRPAAAGASVVFTDHSARIFDGCDATLRAARIGAHVLRLGKQIGSGGVCSPATRWPPRTIARFDRVLSAHHLTWRRTGQRLVLTSARGDTIALHADGPALNVAGHTWALQQFNDLRAYTRTTPPGSAAFVIGHGSVHAQDACTQVIGSATVTLTTIAFSNLRWTNHTCTDPMTVAVSEVMHRVLSGTIKYAIRGNELILYGRRSGPLVYTPSN